MRWEPGSRFSSFASVARFIGECFTIRPELGCDWPYAVRCYISSGVNSYPYQFEVLQRLTRPPITA